MPMVRCTCGAKYNVKPDSLGKLAMCKHCGERFRLVSGTREADPIPLAPAPSGVPDDEIAAAAQRGTEAQRGLKLRSEGRFDAEPADFGYGAPPSRAIPVASGRRARYAHDLLWSFLFITEPHNLVAFLGAWFVLIVGAFAAAIPIVGLAAVFLVQAWWAAFQLNTLSAAANGEDDLPTFGTMEGVWDSLVVPFFRYLATWILALAPAVLFTVYLAVTLPANSGVQTQDYVVGLLRYGDYQTFFGPNSAHALILLVLLLVGLFMWPMFLLVAALGGIGALVRFDLMAATVVKSFPAYLGTVALVIGSYILGAVATALINKAAGGTWSAMLGLGLIARGLNVYITIVAMRVIGLYYHHFKHRFAWSWG